MLGYPIYSLVIADTLATKSQRYLCKVYDTVDEISNKHQGISSNSAEYTS